MIVIREIPPILNNNEANSTVNAYNSSINENYGNIEKFQVLKTNPTMKDIKVWGFLYWDNILSMMGTVCHFFLIASALLFVDIQISFPELNRPLITVLMLHQIPITTYITTPTGDPIPPVTLMIIQRVIVSIIDNHITISQKFSWLISFTYI